MRILVALVLVSITAPGVSAAVVVFDNSTGVFVWTASNFANGTFLDPTIPAQQQPGTMIAIAYSGESTGGGSSAPVGNSFLCSQRIQVLRDTAGFDFTNPLGIVTTFFPATVLAQGETVGPGGNFQSVATAAISGAFLPSPIRLLGQSPTIGFRVTLADGIHYGLIEFDWRPGPRADNSFILMYQPTRWAYETEPNVPIGVPTPAASSLVALAALGLASRRRRGSP